MQKLVIGIMISAALAQSQEKPVAIHPGLGIWRHTIHANNAEAQRFFDQGLALLYGFNMYESARSFRKAVELDPNAPMAYWGVAMATGPYINMDLDPTYDIKASCAAVEAGLKLPVSTPRERAYLEAAGTRCPDFGKPDAYIAAMKSLAARWPDDLDAETLYAESLMVAARWRWYSPEGHAAPNQAEAERTLEQVLRRWPEHPGANHLYIHAVESSPTPERAVPSAQRLMGIMPSAGHMVHMPGHIWLVMGEWEIAATVNERAAEVDREYFASTNAMTSPYYMYYLHNLDFILYARWMQGRREDARKAAVELTAASAPVIAAMPDMADLFLGLGVFDALRFNDWDSVRKLAMPQPKQPMYATMYRYARGIALAARGDKTGARAEQEAFEKARKELPPDQGFVINKSADIVAVAADVLAARIAGDGADGLQHLRNAVAKQDALNYDEPPDWYYPVRESLGGMLLRAGQAGEAEKVFREGNRRTPHDGRMLFGLMESLRALGKTEESEMVRKEFESAWAKADSKLRIEDL